MDFKNLDGTILTSKTPSAAITLHHCLYNDDIEDFIFYLYHIAVHLKVIKNFIVVCEHLLELLFTFHVVE